MYSSTRCIRAEYSARLAFLVKATDSYKSGEWPYSKRTAETPGCQWWTAFLRYSKICLLNDHARTFPQIAEIGNK
jgi:hypothetical protein